MSTIEKAMDKLEEKANARQVGGDHYQTTGLPQHWDLVNMYQWDYFQAQIVKYVMRWKVKYKGNPDKQIEDLKKASHFLQKYLENTHHFIGPTLPPVGNRAVATTRHDLTIDEMMKVITCHELLKNLFEFEGGYGDGTNNYKCTSCKRIERARNLFEMQRQHICVTGQTLMGDADGHYVGQGERPKTLQERLEVGAGTTLATPYLRGPEGP